MKLLVEQTAAKWYIREMDLSDGDQLRIFVRLGGDEAIHPGFSLGVMKDTPRNPGLLEIVEGITFYMEADNLWILEDKRLLIRFLELEDDIAMYIE